MRLNSIEMVNWKCFDHKKITFDRLTLLNWKNGEGKTSLIQAIVLCLFDKRPDNLDFASLVDTSKPTKITLKFTHDAASYVIEREVGKTSAYKLYKNDELISRTRTECKTILNRIIPESILTSLWGYESLCVSNVLNSSYLYEILDNEFKDALNLRQHFTSNKSYNQKRFSTLEKAISNQKITDAQVKALSDELEKIESKIKEKAYISDSDVIKAKQAKNDFETFKEIKAQLDKCKVYTYDRDTCLKLKELGKTKEEWDAYYKKISDELKVEKSKSTGSPLIKYPKHTISALIDESKKNGCKCILCGGDFKEPKLDYDTIDNDKIQRLEAILKDKLENRWDFNLFMESVRYWHLVKQLEPVKYVEDYDFQSILDNYNEETNKLYDAYNEKKALFESMNKDLAKINELLEAKDLYETDKKCISIVDEFIAQAKEHYAESIVESATKLVHEINPRYTKIFLENGIYKAKLYDKDFIKESVLPVASLSNGEKTIVALSLILTIRDLFMPAIPLIMDESFVNLDADNVDAIKRLMNEDTSQWIVVSHDERLVS